MLFGKCFNWNDNMWIIIVAAIVIFFCFCKDDNNDCDFNDKPRCC